MTEQEIGGTPIITTESAHALTSRYYIPKEEAAAVLPSLARLSNGCCKFPGFLNSEIIAPYDPTGAPIWGVVQRFRTAAQVDAWRDSGERQKVLLDFEKSLPDNATKLSEKVSEHATDGGVALCISTEGKEGMDREFMEWTFNIHSTQAGFPGYNGSYLQGPTHETARLWTTLLRFESPEALDRWFTSEERKKLLESGKPVIASESIRKMTSSFPGWFPTDASGREPPRWKGSILVLMVLFPVVVLQGKFIRPYLAGVNPTLCVLILNAISMTIVSFGLMPYVSRAFSGWLLPPKENGSAVSLKGSLIIVAIYLAELALLWELR